MHISQRLPFPASAAMGLFVHQLLRRQHAWRHEQRHKPAMAPAQGCESVFGYVCAHFALQCAVQILKRECVLP